MSTPLLPLHRPMPTLAAADAHDLWWRQVRVRALQGARLVRWLARPGEFPAPEISTAAADFPCLLYERRVPIARRDPDAHPIFEAGKRTNLALAAPAFDGLVLQAGRPFSFWRALGPLHAAAGYRPGMELRGGCVVPALGGGVCLLSNALFAMAVELGWTIVERHGHTLEAVPPRPEEVWGMDATVAWPYVDLRFAPRPEPGRVWLRVRIEGDELRLRALGERPAGVRVLLEAEGGDISDGPDGRVRTGRVRRHVFDAAGRRLGDEVVAENRKRLLDPALGGARRNCFTCDDTTCHAREGLLRAAGGA